MEQSVGNETVGTDLIGTDLVGTDLIGTDLIGAEILGTKIGNYLIREKLGEDRRASLYLAEHEQLNRQIAVRVLHRGAEPAADAIARFVADARQASQIRSPHVAVVLDVGELVGGAPYYTSEWVRGQSLANLLAQSERIPLARVVSIARGVGRGLQAMHAAGLVHGNLRPEEVILAPDGQSSDDDFVKLRGLRASDAPESESNFLYWPPERCLDEEQTPASDVYAFGALVYQMLSGRVPHPAADPRELMKAHLTREPTPLQVVQPSVSDSVSRVVSRALSRDPAARYAEPLQLADALAQAVTGTMPTVEIRPTREPKREPTPVVIVDHAQALRALDAEFAPLPELPEQPDDAPPRSNAPLLIATTIAVLAVAGALLWRTSGTHAPVVSAAKVEPPVAAAPVIVAAPVATPVPVPTPAPAPGKVKISIHATPANAKIFVDLEPVANPSVLEVAPDDWSHVIEAEAPGYQKRSLTGKFSRDASYDLALSAKPTTSQHHTHASSSSVGAATTPTPSVAKPAPTTTTPSSLITNYP